MAKSKKKPKKPKPRIKVAPPSKRHKSVNEKVTTNPWDNISLRDFLRVQGEQQVKLVEGDLIFETEQCGCTQEKGCLDPIEFKNHQVHNGTELTNKSTQIRNETPKTWVDSFMAIFGLKRKL